MTAQAPLDSSPPARSDLRALADCRVLVITFYARVRDDALLGPVFASRIPDHAWPAHLERMASFWYTVLFNEPLYHGNPLAKHLGLPIDYGHFERWLLLWQQTVDELFEGEHATEAKLRAQRIARALSSRLAIA